MSADCAIVVTEASGIEAVLADKSAYVKIFNLNGFSYLKVNMPMLVSPRIIISLCVTARTLR